MNIHPIGEPSEPKITTGDQRIGQLRQMSTEQLRQLGTLQVVYLRSGIRDGELVFVLFGADGVPFVMVDAVETAVQVAAEHGLAFVSIH
jgi:hypothetical protein